MLKPLGNAIIAKKVELQQRGKTIIPDRGREEQAAQLCEIVALPETDPAAFEDAVEASIFIKLSVGQRIYARFRGYILEEDIEGNELFACAVEDVLCIVSEELVQ